MERNLAAVQKCFPELGQKVNGHRLVYLDSAATALKPTRVIERIKKHYELEAANVHRGVHFLSDQATTNFENARKKVAAFINASEDEVVFTKGTTESINIAAHGLGESALRPGDEILLTEMEHHSNIVPWQMAAQKAGAKIKYIPVTESGELDLSTLDSLLTSRVKIAAFTGLSNTLGTRPNVKDLITLFKSKGIITLVDAAQAVTNQKIDVKELGCDFLAFSGHKLFGPNGIGVLYGRTEILNTLPPLLGGGAMIERVEMQGSTYLLAPFRFEAGTPNISGSIGLGEAIDFVSDLGYGYIEKHEADLTQYALQELSKLKKVKILGPRINRGPIFSFIIEGLHHHDVGSVLDREGIAVRTGHHCTQPLMAKLNVTGSVRASFSIYNSRADVDELCRAIDKAIHILG